MDVLVFGAGSLGSLIGGLLARTHEVTLVGRDPHVRTVVADGLEIVGEIGTRVRPSATTDGTDRTADLAIVTVKAYDTEEAIDALSTGRFGAVLSLQNGLTEERLHAGLDVPIVAGTATYGARLLEPGRVECTGVGELVIGPYGGGTDPAVDAIGEAIAASGIDVTVAEDMPRRRWEKLAVNVGINPVTALARVENGALSEPPLASIAHAAALETAAVARRVGVDLPDDVVIDSIETVIEATARNRSSMLQDVEAGRRTEIEAIVGPVVDRADTHGLDVPVSRTLLGLVRGLETGLQ